MDQITNNSRNNNDMEKLSGRRNYIARRNIKEWNQGTRSVKETQKE